MKRESSRRGPALDTGVNGFDDTNGGGSQVFKIGKIRLNEMKRDRQLCRGVLQTGNTEDAIVVVATIIVVMKGHCEC